MKSYNKLWDEYLSDFNYNLAITNATRHKGGKRRKYRQARYYKTHAKEIKGKIILYASNFRNHRHTPKIIYDGIQRKKRTIVVPRMDEQVVHHMVVNILKPIIMKGMYEHSYGSLPNRGTHKAKRQIEKWLARNDGRMQYCLKMDISKFFDSIPHNIIKDKLANLIRDTRFLAVLNEIIDVTSKGLPLGFYSSQWLANWYLQDLDHYIKEGLGADYYIRYMDDMVIWGNNKRKLHAMRIAVDEYLNNKLGLSLKRDWQVFLFDDVVEGRHVGRDLDFLGFRFYRTHTTLRKKLMIKACRKARKICKKPRKSEYDCRQMLSYLGWLDCTDTYGMYKRRIKPFISFGQLKEQISRREKNNNVEKDRE